MKTNDSSNSNENASQRFLKFTCPHCGGNTLDLVYDCLTAVQKVSEIYDNGEVYVTGPIEILEDRGHWYRCHDCGRSLVDWDTDSSVWKDNSLLVEWLVDNCPQKDTELPEGNTAEE